MRRGTTEGVELEVTPSDSEVDRGGDKSSQLGHEELNFVLPWDSMRPLIFFRLLVNVLGHPAVAGVTCIMAVYQTALFLYFDWEGWYPFDGIRNSCTPTAATSRTRLQTVLVDAAAMLATLLAACQVYWYRGRLQEDMRRKQDITTDSSVDSRRILWLAVLVQGAFFPFAFYEGINTILKWKQNLDAANNCLDQRWDINHKAVSAIKLGYYPGTMCLYYCASFPYMSLSILLLSLDLKRLHLALSFVKDSLEKNPHCIIAYRLAQKLQDRVTDFAKFWSWFFISALLITVAAGVSAALVAIVYPNDATNARTTLALLVACIVWLFLPTAAFNAQIPEVFEDSVRRMLSGSADTDTTPSTATPQTNPPPPPPATPQQMTLFAVWLTQHNFNLSYYGVVCSYALIVRAVTAGASSIVVSLARSLA